MRGGIWGGGMVGWMDGWRLHEDDEEQEHARISDIREAG